jgi:hypothetical protein
MRAAIALLLLAVIAVALSGCGGGDERAQTRVYFIDGYRSDLGMRGRLIGEERDLVDPGLGRLVAEVLRGPTASERDERGLISGFPRGVRVATVALADGTARVRLSSVTPPQRWPDGVYATAQLVYTVTELDGVTSLAMTVNGAPCCVYDMQQHPVTKPLTRGQFANWQGAPSDG